MSTIDNLTKCQIFTPEDIVANLLDSVNYIEKVTNKYILENSCGHGNILQAIVHRYINDALNEKLSLKQIKHGLETYIHGYDVDKKCCNICAQALSQVAAEYGIFNVNWNVHNKDFLQEYTNNKITIKFDYIIANPPYINYTELDVKTRDFLRANFTSCTKGKFDYFYPFIEASLNLLATTGQLSFIVPNSIFKNVYAENLREIIKDSIKTVIDYSGRALFDEALTSSVIFTCQNGCNNSILEYVNIVDDLNFNINKNMLGQKWMFIDQQPPNRDIRFGDRFHASIGIATLLNKAFLIKEDDLEDINDHYYLLNVNQQTFKIEKASLRPAASPKSKAYEKNYYIIYPYKRLLDNTYAKFKDVYEFRTAFPRTAEYLQIYKTKLLQRKSDNSARWFEYGRSQALRSINQEKLLLSTIITNNVPVYRIDPETVPFSGIFITSPQGNNLNEANRILASEKFWDYINAIGINANGTSKRITVKDINNFIL